MNKHIRNHQTTRALHGYHFDQMRKAAEAADSEGRVMAVLLMAGCGCRPDGLGQPAPSSPTSHQSPITNHQSHPCAIPGCNRAIRLEYLMCGKHWSMVSIPTQRAVYATWRAYTANGRTPQDGNRYRAARAQAIAEATAVAATEPQRGSSNVAEGNALGPNPARDPRPERASQ